VVENVQSARKPRKRRWQRTVREKEGCGGVHRSKLAALIFRAVMSLRQSSADRSDFLLPVFRNRSS
jgi:hypothetical protein